MRQQSTSHRPERVASVIKRAVSVIVESELDDPRIHGVTVVDATVARDLRNATVWVDIEGEDLEVLKALKSSAGYVRRMLCESIS